MNIREITIRWLVSNGYDGLAGDECGCGVDDLMPCGECWNDCVAAKKELCDGSRCENCDGDANSPAECIAPYMFRPAKDINESEETHP